MIKHSHFYILHLQFLGFRYHGWQKQPSVKTVQLMIERTLYFTLGHENMKIMGASRTDAMVSSQHFLCELFISEEIDLDEFQQNYNKNLPADIRLLRIEQTDAKFNIIQDIDKKEYHYYFSYGEKPHPFSAPFSVHFDGELQMDKLSAAATKFIGKHNFKFYCYRPKEDKDYTREILECEVHKNHLFTGDFFPKESYYLKVVGRGFVHHQIRFMIGTLIRIARGEKSLEQLVESLTENTKAEAPIGFVAPASGLHLYQLYT